MTLCHDPEERDALLAGAEALAYQHERDVPHITATQDDLDAHAALLRHAGVLLEMADCYEGPLVSTPGRLDLLGDLHGALEAQRHLSASLMRAIEAQGVQIADLWQDNADLRDELHAVANRLEALTRAVGPHAA